MKTPTQPAIVHQAGYKTFGFLYCADISDEKGLLPSLPHAVRWSNHYCVDSMDLSVFNLKTSSAQECCRARKSNGKGHSVGHGDFLDVPGMIETGNGEDQAALLVDDKVPPAYPGHELEKAGFELFLTAEGHNVEKEKIEKINPPAQPAAAPAPEKTET